MKVLISPVSLEEAMLVADNGADIVDIKNTNEGSLGANFPWVIHEVTSTLLDRQVTFSATLGDLDYKPGTAALAALGAAYSGAKYIKAGVYGAKTAAEAGEVMTAVQRACKDFDPGIVVVTAGYADYRRFGGLDPSALVEAAIISQSDVVMVDTAIKDGADLLDNMSIEEIADFIDLAHKNDLVVAVAGSVKAEHLSELASGGADIVGVRGAVCGKGDRTTAIEVEAIRDFIARVRAIAPPASDPAEPRMAAVPHM
ncbi:MAG: (5-formylfuran-3-yl)methyl phosphate synthase [Pseudomonadota bacterium]